jgi:branched-chain amino acid transport system permease protein
MQEFLHQLLSGIASGAIYASLAVALVTVYKTTHHVNFAQGELAMFSTYVCWALIQAGMPYWGAFAVTLVASFVGAVILHRVVIERVADQPVLTVVIVMIGLILILRSLAGWIWTNTIRAFPSPFPSDAPYASVYLSAHEVGMVAVTLVALACAFVFFRYTTVGLAMRAAAENPVSSRLVGIRVDWMLAMGWGLAAIFGAVAGMMAAPLVYLEPNMMTGILLYGFAGALLGGIENPWGAVGGGFAVGIIENLAGAYVVGTEVKLAVALLLIVGVLIFRPAGVFGRRVVARV